MVFTFTHIGHEVVLLGHSLVVKKEVGVECALETQVAAEVRFRLFDVITELPALAHTIYELRSNELRRLFSCLPSKGLLNNLFRK